MGSGIAWFSTKKHKTASLVHISRLSFRFYWLGPNQVKEGSGTHASGGGLDDTLQYKFLDQCLETLSLITYVDIC